MGCISSSEEKAARQRSKQIDEMLRVEAEKKLALREVDILMIGTRHCGKSSLLKQVKTIFCDKSSSHENSNESCTTDLQFVLKDVCFRIIQLDGHLLSRQKLYHYFEDINAIIIIISLSNYDHVTDDDENVLLESIESFKTICNAKGLCAPLLFLFLSKKDLFEEKLKTTPLSVCFPEYTGPNTYEDAGAYIQRKFECDPDVNKVDRDIMTHVINTADTQNINFLIDAVTDIIIKDCNRCTCCQYLF